MGRASESCKYCCIHFVTVLFIMVVALYGFEAYPLLDFSENLVTGGAVIDDQSYAKLTVNNQADWYQRLLEQYGVVVESSSNQEQTVLSITGYNNDVYSALLSTATQADRQGDLVSYSMSVES